MAPVGQTVVQAPQPLLRAPALERDAAVQRVAEPHDQAALHLRVHAVLVDDGAVLRARSTNFGMNIWW